MSKQRRGHKQKPKAPKTKPPVVMDDDSDDHPESTLHYKANGKKGATREKQERREKTPRRKSHILATPKDAKQTRSDLKLVERAIRQRWDIKNKGMLQRRLMEVVNKPTVPILTKQGVFDSEADADANAIAATRVLVQMNAQDQEDDQFEIKQKNPQAGNVVNVNFNDAENNRTRLLALASRLGVSSLEIDGVVIPSKDLVNGMLENDSSKGRLLSSIDSRTSEVQSKDSS